MLLLLTGSVLLSTVLAAPSVRDHIAARPGGPGLHLAQHTAPQPIHKSVVRAARSARHEDLFQDDHQDNEAAATDGDGVESVDNAEPQYQEARHYSRVAHGDDNYEDEQDIVYDFSYEVKDPHTGNDFGHRQSRSGGLTQGQYRVLLPDGRMQVVDYVSDRDGFRPNIRYEDVGIPVFAGSEQHEQFADGSNHFEQQQQDQGHSVQGGGSGDTQNPSPEDVRRRRRRRR